MFGADDAVGACGIRSGFMVVSAGWLLFCLCATAYSYSAAMCRLEAQWLESQWLVVGSKHVFLSVMTHDAAPLRCRGQVIFHSPPELVSIRRVDEAVVIGAALSLSSSAFVLKILQVCT